MVDLLRRAWDALNTFKQTYPENWHEEDEQVLKDLMRADLKLSGVEQKVEELEQRPWVGLTDEDLEFWTKELGQEELGRGVLRAVADHLKKENT